MNNKGFTLIELLATIVLLSLIISLTAMSVVGFINASKEKSYDILIENIKIGAQGYFEECENVNIIGDTTIDCNLNGNTAEITLGKLLDYGFLKSSATRTDVNNIEYAIIENPKTNKDISDCEIKINKSVDPNNLKVVYEIKSVGSDVECPEIN